MASNNQSSASHFLNPSASAKIANKPRELKQFEHVIDDLTLVSLYMDLGDLKKGEGKGKDRLVYTRDTYVRWMAGLARLLNPLVFYTEVPELRDLLERERSVVAGRAMTSARVDLRNRTRAFLFERSTLHSFRHYLPRIRDILRNPPYPRFNPNTVVPEYGATMHAKFDVLERAIRANYFNSKYFAWIDVGVFRDVGESGVTAALTIGASLPLRPVAQFGLLLPPQFDERRVASGEVFELNFTLTPEQIVAHNGVWVCGCMFAAERRVMLRFAEQYAAAVEAMHERALSSTDQQVFYSMYTNTGRSWLPGSPVEVQPFIRDLNHCSMNQWFFFAYLCKEQ